MIKDITGLRSGKLVALYPTTQNKHRNYKWMCQCDCGNTKEVVSSAISKGLTKTCGCSGKAHKILPDGESAFNELFGRYKSQAKSRGYSFELEKEEFKTLTVSNCHYCGQTPKSVAKSFSSSYVYNGVDRKNNTQGYHTYNVVSCCDVCNRAKRDLSYEDFTSWIGNLIKFNLETK